MRPRLVVVLEPDSQDALKVATIENQKPIDAFAPGRANVALDVRIRPGRRNRSLDHGHTVGLEHAVGATAVLVIVIVDQEPRRHAQLVELPAHIPGLLAYPLSVWPVGHREPDHPPGRQLHI